MSHDTFMNPMAPPGYEDDRNHNSKKLSNADFRKLLMTPRGTPGSAASSLGSTNLGSTRAHHSGAHVHQRIDITSGAESNAEKRRKKKQFYAKLKKDEDDVLAELSKKYRDRAQERREEIKVKGEDEEQNLISGYRAVAPDLKSGMDQAERRRQLIQESKFLGGDMEHTHLVKGLDYALLQKVRSEIHAHERAVDDELEKVADVKPAGLVVEAVKPIESEPEFKTKMGRNIHRLLIESAMPERNELFVPGRMAYVIDLEDDTAESDIPTTTVRSKADCPNIESQATLSTNDIVINKLTQILAYLRQGGARAGKKMKKKDRQRYEDMKGRTYDDPIFPDIGHYEPTLARDKEKKRAAMSYFDKPVSELEEEERRKEKEIHESYDWKNIKGQKELVDAASTGDPKDPAEAQKQKEILSRLDTVGYAECYPGLEEMNDAIEDSDDEADYTKMDMGNKKGPIGRWDFDTQEEYSNYMSQKEALPKAAFQYGVKMADGRKTRRIPRNEKNEKAELDREWKKIQNILDKRKSERGGGGSSEKKAKYS